MFHALFHACVLSCVLPFVLQIDIIFILCFHSATVICNLSHWTLPLIVLRYYLSGFVAFIDCYIMLCYGSEGSGPFACSFICLYFLCDFIDIYLTCCRFAYCRIFICMDIRFELLCLLYSFVIFF